MECSGGPEGPLGASRLLELFQDLFLPRARNDRSPARSFLGDETVDAIRVESLYDLLHRAFGKVEGTHGLFPGTAREKQNNDRTPAIGLPGFRTLGCIEIRKGCVLGVGSEIPLRHDPYVTTCLRKCLGITTANGNYFCVML